MITTKVFFPLVVTDELENCRDFFTRHFGCRVVFESDWYVHLVTPHGAQIGFLASHHGSQPHYLQEPLRGAGLVFSFEVEAVDEAFATAERSQLGILSRPKTEEWGQRHFMVRAPSGIIVDVIQNVDEKLNLSE